MFVKIILYCYLFIIPIIILRRYTKNPKGSLLNPVLYLLVFSYLYFVIPSLYIDYVYELLPFSFSEHATNISQWLCVWYTTIFTLFYFLSRDFIIEFSEAMPSRLTYQISVIICILIPLVALYIIVRYVPSIYELKDNRILALSYYEETVNGPFKLRILQYIHIGAAVIVFWRTKKLWVLLPFFLYWIIDFSHGGRTVTFMTFIFMYILLVLKTEKLFIKQAAFLVLIMIITGLIQRSTSTELLWNLYLSGAEFSFTRVTTTYLLDHHLIPAAGNGAFEYFLVSLARTFPGGLMAGMLGFKEWYGHYVSLDANLGFGLAGNLISEALYYGGIPFAIISPLITGGFLCLINNFKLHRNILGLLYILLICINMQNILRSFFYGFMFYPLSVIFFPLVFILPESGKKVFR